MIQTYDLTNKNSKEIRNVVYEYGLSTTPIELRTRDVRRCPKGMRCLTQVSSLIRAEFLPLYLRNEFLHTYTSATSLRKFLGSFVPETLPQNSNIKLVIRIQFPPLASVLLQILRYTASTGFEGRQVRFQCEDWHPTTIKTLNRAIQKRSLWQSSVSKIAQIVCYRHTDTPPKVCLKWDVSRSRFLRSNAVEVWESLGFTIE